MTLSQTLGVGCLVLNQTCGKLAKPLQRSIEKMISKNGPEWTCVRLKAIYTAALNLADGKCEEARQIYQKNSISYDKRSLLPKGEIGVLVGQYLSAVRPSVIRRKAAALRFYTCMALPNGTPPTKRQIRKALPAITEPSDIEFEESPSEPQIFHGAVRGPCVTVRIPLGTPGRQQLIERANAVRPGARMRASKGIIEFWFVTGDDMDVQLADNPTAIADFCEIMLSKRMKYSSYKAKPIRSDEDGAEHLRVTSYYYSPVKTGAMKGIPYGPMVLSLNSTEWVPESLDGATRCAEMRAELREHGLKDPCAGRIWCIQEQGFKPRFAAQPTAWLQLACQPFHQRLNKACLHLFPKECDTEDQAAGAYDALQHMRDGNRVYCVDLSSATDRFPREITTRLIRRLGYPQFADALEEISQAKWEAPWSGSQYVSYSIGQPMGLYGSFPAFALTNLCLCETSVALATSKELIDNKDQLGQEWKSSLKPFPSGAFYHVLGDDVVFSDPKVAEAYRGCLNTLGVAVSSDKCFDGGHIAEYAGFILRVTERSCTAYRPYKVPSSGYITNPVDFVHALGASVCTIPKRSGFWARVFRAYSASSGSRDITLAPLVSDDSEVLGITNRANASDLVTLSRHLGYLLEEEGFTPEELDRYFPCLSGDSRINRRPLIDEARPDQLHRYDPNSFVRSRDDKPKAFSATVKRVNQDPLLRDYIKQEKSLEEPVSDMRRSPFLREAKTLTPSPSTPDTSVTPELTDSAPADEPLTVVVEQPVGAYPSTNGSLDRPVPDCSPADKPSKQLVHDTRAEGLRRDPAFSFLGESQEQSQDLGLC